MMEKELFDAAAGELESHAWPSGHGSFGVVDAGPGIFVLGEPARLYPTATSPGVRSSTCTSSTTMSLLPPKPIATTPIAMTPISTSSTDTPPIETCPTMVPSAAMRATCLEVAHSAGCPLGRTRAPVATTVWLAVYEHGFGLDISVHASSARAKQALVEVALAQCTRDADIRAAVVARFGAVPDRGADRLPGEPRPRFGSGPHGPREGELLDGASSGGSLMDRLLDEWSSLAEGEALWMTESEVESDEAARDVLDSFEPMERLRPVAFEGAVVGRSADCDPFEAPPPVSELATLPATARIEPPVASASPCDDAREAAMYRLLDESEEWWWSSAHSARAVGLSHGTHGMPALAPSRGAGPPYG